MIKHWLTIGMSSFSTPGFQDTSRLMTSAFEGQVAYVEPPKPFSSWRRLNGRLTRWESDHSANWNVFTPPLPIPRKVDPLSMAYKRQTSNLANALSELWGDNWRSSTVCYITNWTPFQQRLIERLDPTYLVFDCVDDILSFPYDWDRDAVVSAWRKLASSSVKVLAVSPKLRHDMETLLDVPIDHSPNGVDATGFMKPSGIPPADVREEGRIKVGFAGTLNHWIDFDSMIQLATEYPDITLYLMGRQGNFRDEAHKQAFHRLTSLDNVKYLGAIPYPDLPSYLHAMDVLLLPRTPGPASVASSPLKLYEYLAVGKPIVTYGVPIPPDMESFVYSARDQSALVEPFRDAVAEATGRSQSLHERRQSYALANTWSHRMKRVLEGIE
ncbi:glycosyltransferase [Alicyclobacillus dauci]|uniref:Glycosyltransferase n=1 Tax=Alicyclobacillus dauci TaxID=1475485 RepID=A0ABY6Z0V0_9BACL|nr:glycosyltransferase [Alicyclobacillus dauci]WAH35600.1 glycosyltransferase [Alicyclobacillus dauci]